MNSSSISTTDALNEEKLEIYKEIEFKYNFGGKYARKIFW